MIKLGVRCHSCGDDNWGLVSSEKYLCKSCGEPLIKPDVDKINIDFEIARDHRLNYRFNESVNTLRQIMNETSNERIKVKCNYHLLLARFGVVFVKDFGGNMIPTFIKYDSKIESITKTNEYDNIIKSSYGYEYTDQLKRLCDEYDRIFKVINQTSKRYDVFICTKVSKRTLQNPYCASNDKTDESKAAEELYNELTALGYKVFYSEKSLGGSIMYDADIYNALFYSNNMVVVKKKSEYLNTPWVKSEWERWLYLIDIGVKTENSLNVYYIAGVDNKENIGRLETVQKVDKEVLLDNLKETITWNRRKETFDMEEVERRMKSKRRTMNFSLILMIITGILFSFILSLVSSDYLLNISFLDNQLFRIISLIATGLICLICLIIVIISPSKGKSREQARVYLWKRLINKYIDKYLQESKKCNNQNEYQQIIESLNNIKKEYIKKINKDKPLSDIYSLLYNYSKEYIDSDDKFQQFIRDISMKVKDIYRDSI